MLNNELLHFAGLAVVLVVLLLVDLKLFARGREPSFKEGAWWSLGWLALSLIAALGVWAIDGRESAVLYTTVYLIERSLSLDNLFVFILLFAYFGVPTQQRARLLFWGILFALVLRGGAIAGGTALIDEFHFVTYLLGALLLVLAFRILRGIEENVHPDRNVMVRAVRRFFPVTADFRGRRWFVMEGERRFATPLFLALAAVVFADIAFAVDSIPAAFAITTDPFLVWMGNVFALLGLRALFVLVEGLIRRFRYLDETIALVLALVAVKLLLQDLVELGPLPSLAIVAVAFAAGIAASLVKDRAEAEDERPQA